MENSQKNSQKNSQNFTNIESALLWGAKQIKEAKISARARLESEMILAHTLKKERIFLHAHSQEPLDRFSEERFMRYILRRCKAEPVEYIIERVGFYGRSLYISAGALIPRPESEILVDKARVAILEILDKSIESKISVLEVGIGSGAVLCTLAAEFPQIQFYGSDLSAEALFNAFFNIYELGLKNVRIFSANLLDFLAPIESNLIESSLIESKSADLSQNTIPRHFELIISNPPYIPNKEAKNLPKPLAYEPKSALFGGERGSEILEKLILQASKFAQPRLICEMGFDQKEAIKNIMQNIKHKKLEFYKDLSGLDRGFEVIF